MRPSHLSANAAVQHLKAGAVLLMTTDTLPGLHCRADDVAAVAEIIKIKGRSAEKSLLVLAGSLAQARAVLGELTPAQESVCAACWPGPFSLILPKGRVIGESVSGGRATLAVRVPSRDDLRELILQVGVPLVSTSANRAGEPPAETLEAAQSEFGAEVAGSWQGDQSPVGQAVASALVDLTVEPFRILRQGPQPFSAV